MKAIDFYNEEQLDYARKYLGIADLTWDKYTEKRKAILSTVVNYQEGWVDEDSLEDKLTKIIKSK